MITRKGQTTIYKTIHRKLTIKKHERVSNSYSTSGTHRIYLVTYPVIGHEWTLEVLTRNGTYPSLFATQILHKEGSVDKMNTYEWDVLFTNNKSRG